MASKEELQRLVRAMNPDAEQIEEATAAAPRVPGAVKALGRGFYEANIAPLLSPYETAMAIFGAGKEMVRAPVETTKSMARSELERLQQAEGSPEAAAEYAGGMFSPFSMLRRAPTMREITAYQGSPTKFEPTPNNPLGEFDVSKAGSGVGQQNRGPGTYIAENPKVAERYRMKYSPVMNIGEQRSPGYKYTVDLPDPMIEKMLDLDAPIVNQSKFIRDKIMQVSNDPALPPDSAELLRQLLTSKDRALQKYPLTGLGLVSVPREFGGIFKDVTEANTILQRYGIPGSKWKDDISRGPDKGTRNFVVFPGEEKKVKILEREGPKGERAFSENPQLRTPEFKKFIQGSKVVDEENRPIRLYHATDAESDFDEFDTSDFGSWFAEDPETAMGYANKGHGGAPRTFPVYLNVKKPLYIPEEIDLSEDVNAAKALDLINKRNKTDITLEEIGQNPRGDWDLSNQGNEYGFALFGLNDLFVDALKKRGFDGYQAFEQGKSTWNAFSPEQIKSAVGNVGKFDPESPVLTKAEGGEVRPLAKRR